MIIIRISQNSRNAFIFDRVLRAPLPATCREAPSVEESHKQYFCRGVWSRNFGRRENPRHRVTFRIITRDRPGGFRYRFVSFELIHQRMVWYKGRVPEQILREESDGTKVRVGDQHLVDFSVFTFLHFDFRFGRGFGHLQLSHQSKHPGLIFEWCILTYVR